MLWSPNGYIILLCIQCIYSIYMLFVAIVIWGGGCKLAFGGVFQGSHPLCDILGSAEPSYVIMYM